VFADPELTRNTPRIRIPTLFTGDLRNDLEPVTCKLYSPVAESLSWLGEYGNARMTGSGSGLFVAVPDRASGEAILAKAPPGNWGFLAWGTNLHPLREVEPDGV
jgi:4-diphosphocytidyl-2-C-methyl-D-erythritol kinase